MKTAEKYLLILLGLAISACSQEPSEIHYGSDECQHCRMIISDDRFAAQMVTEKGKALKFDAIECLAAYSNEHSQSIEGARYWVSYFSQPGQWLSVENAKFIKSEVIKSPMGESLLALSTSEEVEENIEVYPGQKISWDEIVNLYL